MLHEWELNEELNGELNGELEGYSVLEDGDFAVVVLLVAGFLARCHAEHLVDEFRHELLHGAALNELQG